MRPHPVSVQDRRDGTYLITFVPEIPGNIQLAIHINGKPMKVSFFDNFLIVLLTYCKYLLL